MGAVVTGQPTDKNERQNDKDRQDTGARSWDDRTAALAARLEALLEQHRGQQGEDAAGQAGTSPARPLRKPR